MKLRNKFWNELYELGHTLEYYKQYRLSSAYWNRVLSAISMIGTGGGIAGLCFFPNYEILSAFVAGAFTVLQFATPFLRFSDRIAPLQFAVQDLQHLFNQMERCWDDVDNLTDKQISKRLHKYCKQWEAIENQYLSGLELKPVQRFSKRAEKSNEAHFAYYYDIQPSDYERSSQ